MGYDENAQEVCPFCFQFKKDLFLCFFKHVTWPFREFTRVQGDFLG